MIDYDYLAGEYVTCLQDESRIYMIEHYLSTYDATQRRRVPFELFPRQKDLCQTLGDANNVVTTKPRQAGITTTAGAFISCEMILADPSSPQTVLIIGNSRDLAQQMLVKIRDFLLQFPNWLWGDMLTEQGLNPMGTPTKKQIFDVCNKDELVLKNGCRVVARSSGPDASRGVGGVTWLIFDEAAFIENGKDVYASALPTVSTGGHIIMISTPNGKDLLYYETCRQAKLKGTDDWNNFELVELKWYQDPRYNKFLEWTRKDEETGEIIVIQEKYIDQKGNIRYDQNHWDEMIQDGWKPRSPWYQKMCKQFNNDSQKIAQELDVSFLGSAANVVEPEFIEMQTKLNKREPIYRDKIEEDTWIWKEYIPGHKYVMCIDCSRGDAADRTALEIFDIHGIDDDGTPCMEQVLEYHGKKTGDVVGEMAYQYGKMYNNPFCVVDCVGGTGDACILMMIRLGYKNLYYDDPLLKSYTSQVDASSLPVNKDGKLPGFHSNQVRYQMLTNFANLVKTNQFKIRSKRVLAELDTWIYKGPQARIDHQDGAHDDTLTCLAMGLFVMEHSMARQEKTKEHDKAILRSWTTGNIVVYKEQEQKAEEKKKKKLNMPFYSTQTLDKSRKYASHMWVLK